MRRRRRRAFPRRTSRRNEAGVVGAFAGRVVVCPRPLPNASAPVAPERHAPGPSHPVAAADATWRSTLRTHGATWSTPALAISVGAPTDERGAPSGMCSCRYRSWATTAPLSLKYRSWATTAPLSLGPIRP
jgi:hypothetical protein